MGDNFGRPPGSATTIAGPSLAPMWALNQHRHLPHHQNDDGATNIMHARQVDHNPPRFEVIESDDKSEDCTTSSEEVELEETPPVDEVTPTTLWQPTAASSPMVPTVSTISANDEFFKKLSENILLGVNTAFERNQESELNKFHLLLGLLERQAQGNEEHQQVLPVESVTGPAGLQEHLFLINCILFFGNPLPACPMLFSLQKQGFFIARVTL